MAEKKVQAIGLDVRVKRALIETGADGPHICRHRERVGLNLWYTKERSASESREIESRASSALMRRIVELYFAYPLYGSRRITAVLRREGFTVKRKRVRRLLRLIDL